MIHLICEYVKKCKCNHDFEFIGNVKDVDSWGNAYRYHKTYRCKKCGYTQRVKL